MLVVHGHHAAERVAGIGLGAIELAAHLAADHPQVAHAVEGENHADDAESNDHVPDWSALLDPFFEGRRLNQLVEDRAARRVEGESNDPGVCRGFEKRTHPSRSAAVLRSREAGWRASSPSLPVSGT